MHCSVLALLLFLLADGIAGKPPTFLEDGGRYRRTEGCENLADAADKILNYAVMSPYVATINLVRETIRRLAGRDLVQRQEMTRVACRIAESTNLMELRQALDELGITYHLVKVTYDYLTAAYSLVRPDWESRVANNPDDVSSRMQLLRSALDLFDIMERRGLIHMDPEGTTWVLEHIFPFSPGLRPTPGPGATSCEIAVDGLDTILDIMVFNISQAHFTEQIISTTQEWTGIQLRDHMALNEMVCNALSVNSIQEIIDFLDMYDIPQQAMNTGYPIAVETLRILNRQQQAVLEEWGNSQDGSDDNDYLEHRAASARVAVQIYAALESSGLLDF